MKEIKADLIGKGKKFGIIVSRFNEFITTKLLEGACDTLTRHAVSADGIETVWAPGAFEILMWPRRWPNPRSMMRSYA